MNNKKSIGYGACGAKVILIGEHSVVYNNPAIAMPFNGLKTEVNIYKTVGEITIDSMYHKGNINAGSDTIGGIEQLIYYILNNLKMSLEGYHFEIKSNIIAQRGLGSSAAVSIAIIKAMYDAFGLALSDELLIELATFAEKIHHTNPSGLDVNVLVYQKPIWFERDKGFKVIDIKFEGTLMIIDSGIPSKTKLAVEHVAMLFETKKDLILKNFNVLNQLTKDALSCLKYNEIHTLGVIMNVAHKALSNVEVSSDVLDKLVTKVRKLGALGAKLTGGGVGGCIIALTNTTLEAENIKKQLTNDKISNVWISPLKDLN